METRFEELKRYVRFTENDARRLLALREVAAPHFPAIAQEFYERIREHEEAHAVLTGEEQILRLQKSLVAWLERLLGGTYDERYYEQTQRIGRVHVKVGLPQRYMFTAMALIRSSLDKIAQAAISPTRPDARDALGRILDLELAIMVESYREDMSSRLERLANDEREVLSRRLATTERRYVQAVELADAIIVGLSRSGQVLLFNKQAERVTGYARDEALGRDFVELVLPSDVHEAQREFFCAGDGHTSRHRELPLRTRAGKIRDVRWHVVALPSSVEAHDVEWLVMGHDVTEERAKRAHDQQQERLAAVGTLAAGLAHEIRNPLNGARLHVSFLERTLAQTGASAETMEAVQIVQDEIKRLARLVTDFLDFARPRPLARVATSVRSLCERVVQLAAATAGDNVSLALDLPTTDIVLESDKDRLEQVLLNLLQNAIEALGTTGGTVVLRARRQPRHVWLEVEDDGPGLPGNAPVFDAFFSTKPNGTGLGLAIAHRVVTDHGGVIDVESRPGQTRFRVLLPLRQQGNSE
jgi:PAS domain S-box-containing protein